jgi:hypothetical protein
MYNNLNQLLMIDILQVGLRQKSRLEMVFPFKKNIIKSNPHKKKPQ